MLGKVHANSLLSQSVRRLVLDGEKIVDQSQKCDRRDMIFFLTSGQLLLFCLVKRFIVRNQASTSFSFSLYL